tara:strand:- start:558 stop:2135 length:1578 start_codon:yes stop_codon:yes gene_type:complete
MSRDYKKEYREYHSKLEQKKNRAKRNKANRNSNCGPGQEVDHKIPLSKGGGNSSSNWRVVSRTTNRKKGSKKMSSLNKLKLAIEKTAEEESRSPNAALTYAGLGLGGSGLMLGSGLAMQSEAAKEKVFFPSEMDDFVEKTMKGKRVGEHQYHLPTKDGGTIGLNYKYQTPDAYLSDNALIRAQARQKGSGADLLVNMGDSSTPRANRGTIALGHYGMGNTGPNKTILMHELGHATGSPRWAKAYPYVNVGAKGVSTLAGLSSLKTLYDANFGDLSKEDRDALVTKAKIEAGLGVGAQLPTLAEEARATIRAKGLADKFGVKLNNKLLRRAYGTYLGKAVAASALPIAGLMAAKNNQVDGDSSDTRRRNLALGGAALAATGLGAYNMYKNRGEKVASTGAERLPSGGIKYRGETFPGYNKPKTAPSGSKHKKRVLAKKGDKVKVVNFGARGYKHNYSAKAKKSYLARSAGIKGKDDKFSANYWSRSHLWPKGQKADGSSKKTKKTASATDTFDTTSVEAFMSSVKR